MIKFFGQFDVIMNNDFYDYSANAVQWIAWYIYFVSIFVLIISRTIYCRDVLWWFLAFPHIGKNTHTKKPNRPFCGIGCLRVCVCALFVFSHIFFPFDCSFFFSMQWNAMYSLTRAHGVYSYLPISFSLSLYPSIIFVVVVASPNYKFSYKINDENWLCTMCNPNEN